MNTKFNFNDNWNQDNIEGDYNYERLKQLYTKYNSIQSVDFFIKIVCIMKLGLFQ